MRSLSVTTIRRMASPAVRRMSSIRPLAREADRRCVDDREELLEIVDEEAVEQGLVAVVECGEADITLEVITLASDVLQVPGDLLLERRHSRWQQAVEAKGITLGGGEGRALVEEWLCEKRVTADGRSRHRIWPDGRGRDGRRANRFARSAPIQSRVQRDRPLRIGVRGVHG